ncbi:MAG: LamG domain-containing protein [Spirochaetota bacterium]
MKHLACSLLFLCIVSIGTAADGILGIWKFDVPSAVRVEDSSGNGYHASLTGAKWVLGSFGTALLFDKPGTGLDLPKDAGKFDTGSFTLSFWICPFEYDTASKYRMKRIMGVSEYPKRWWNVDMNNDGIIEMEMGLTPAGAAAPVNGGSSSSAKVPLKAWTCIVITVDRDAGKTRFYCNGELDAERPIPAAFTGPLSMQLPVHAGYNGENAFLGLFDELMIAARAVTADEVRAAFERKRTGRQSIGYTAAAIKRVVIVEE